MARLQVGMRAPAFRLPADDGRPVALSEFSGRRVVLYVYPKDDTPGCTTEACEFRDAARRFAEQEAILLGISPDGPESHARFRKKFGLPFRLLSGEDRLVCRAYGVWGRKRFLGRSFLGVRRTTFVIGPDGRIERLVERVRPKGHAAELLAALASPQSEDADHA